MAGHGSKYERKQEAVITALLTHRNVEEAAEAAGVSKRTLQRWQSLPEFQAAFREARRAAMAQAHARLQQASSAAVSALLKVMVDANTPASVRVRAADCVLARGNQGLQYEDLEVRLAALERAAEIMHVSPATARVSGLTSVISPKEANSGGTDESFDDE